MSVEADVSPHDQWCIQIRNPTKDQRDKIRSIVMNSWIDDEEYKLSQQAGAFLQCDYENYLLVEFWTENFEPFIDFINQQKEFGG